MGKVPFFLNKDNLEFDFTHPTTSLNVHWKLGLLVMFHIIELHIKMTFHDMEHCFISCLSPYFRWLYTIDQYLKRFMSWFEKLSKLDQSQKVASFWTQIDWNTNGLRLEINLSRRMTLEKQTTKRKRLFFKSSINECPEVRLLFRLWKLENPSGS